MVSPLCFSGCGDRESDSAKPTAEPPAEALPEFVYVLAPGFRVKLTVDLPTHVKVGQPVRLRARRESIGEWQKVRYSTLPTDTFFLTSPGPVLEPEVAANLSWFTDPPNAMKGDTGLRSLALGMEREAVFLVQGVVQVWALTAMPMREKSNVIAVVVEG